MSKRCEVESDHKKCWRTSCHINRQCMRDAACAPAPEPTRQDKTLQDAMLSVLCDPEGVPCFRGSDGDRKIIAEALSTPPDTAALDKACKLYAAGVLEEMLNQQAQGSYGNLMLKTKQRVDQLRKEAGE